MLTLPPLLVALCIAVGFVLPIWAFAYEMFHGKYTPNDPMPLHVAIIGGAGIVILALPLLFS
jgi:hypothetical protein